MRTTLLLGCAGLSFMGFIWPLWLLASGRPFAVFLAVICIYAWVCYFVMGVAWARNERAKKWWPYSGTVAALASPFTGALVSANTNEGIQVTLSYFVFVLPAVLLAIWLVVFHMKPGTINAR
jgi:type VI protein secretion system component VasK